MTKQLLAYVHFPWCLEKCPYCDFASEKTEREAIDHDGYADAVIRELALRRESLADHELRSVFFGGGTPSLWKASALGRVLAAIRAAVPETDDIEITVECNPSSLDETHARALLDVGVNRLSIGVQALDDARLAFLGRLHDADGALAALSAARRAGFERLSGDLIYGVHDQPPEAAARDARALAEGGLTHASAYSLTIEPGTKFGELARRGRLPLADDARLADSFFAVDEAFAASGLGHYEISNFAVPGQESRHNLGYWQGVPYVGLGAAAVGSLGASRWTNQRDPRRYAKATNGAIEAIVANVEPLDADTRLRERIMLGLRLASGFDLEKAAADVGAEAWTDERLRSTKRLVERGRLERDGAWLKVPKSAWVFADGTAAELFLGEASGMWRPQEQDQIPNPVVFASL